MTIQEAIRSGKPFRAAPNMPWLLYDRYSEKLYDANGDNRASYTPTTKDLISDSWELRSEPREWNAVFNKHGYAIGLHLVGRVYCAPEDSEVIRVREVIE